MCECDGVHGSIRGNRAIGSMSSEEVTVNQWSFRLAMDFTYGVCILSL